MASAVHTQTHALAQWANTTAQVVLVDVGATVGRLSTRQCVLVSSGKKTGAHRHGQVAHGTDYTCGSTIDRAGAEAREAVGQGGCRSLFKTYG